MKLASLKGGRDGRLVVVSDDLAYFAYAGHIATTLQDVLDNWEMLAPKLELLATDLAHAVIPRERFHERDAASPLPRAFGWIVRGASDDPELSQSASDGFRGARDPLWLEGESVGLLSRIAVVTDDVPMGVSAAEAGQMIRLVGLSLDYVAPAGGNVGTSFSPVFVTPDSLGSHWSGSKLHGTLCADGDSNPLSRADANADFGALIAQAATTRNLGAGTIIGSGPIAAPGTKLSLARGETVRIWMDDEKNHPIFGVIEQKVG
jgi:fumarylacetoacetate (FAA) hydrolase